MNLGLILNVVSLMYVILITIIYFSKKRIVLLENKVYELLLLFTNFGLIVNFISFILDIYFPGQLFLRTIFIKLYYFFILVFLLLMTLYLFISNGVTKRKSINGIIGVYIIIFIINFFLPITFIDSSTGTILSGPNINFVYLIFIISILMWTIFILVTKKRKHVRSRKYLPTIVYVALCVPVLIIQMIFPELLLETCLIAFVLVLMYFTIENPDVRMLNELELAKKNAEKANNAKTDFLSNMSHEIRTPLNAIVGFSNSILEDKTLEEAKEEAKDIIMASNNLLEIVNGILDISKIEAGKMEIVNVDYYPLEMFNDIAKLIRPRIAEKPIELKVKFSEDIPAVLNGDMGKVKEIITNILTNAAKYTDEGLITFEVNCINQKNESKLIISVEDTGRGIKPEKIDKLFTKFQRLEEDKNTTLEGTGLGLAITKSLVDMMGGKIIVQSKYGSGSKFTVYLSQKIISLSDNNVKVEEEVEEILDYSSKKVLVVDDNNLNIKVATRLLKNYNIIPDTCLSGLECLEKVKNINYDLILMDDMMPKMSGVETFHKLKEDTNFKTPVVILTANAISGMKEKYLSEGLDDYLAKPIDKLELKRVISKFLNKK